MINRYTCAVFALLVLAGCASDPAPTEQLRLTEQALAQAKAVGANEQVAELRLAEDKLQQAQAAMADKAYKEARVLTEKSQEQLTELSKRIDRLRRQLGDLQ